MRLLLRNFLIHAGTILRDGYNLEYAVALMGVLSILVFSDLLLTKSVSFIVLVHVNMLAATYEDAVASSVAFFEIMRCQAMEL